MTKRTKTEIDGSKLAVQKLKMYPEWAVYEKEVKRIKDAIASSMFKEDGNNIYKASGILHGLDIALNITELENVITKA